MKLVEKLKKIGTNTLTFALAGAVVYMVGSGLYTGIRSTNDLGRTIRDARRVEHIIQKGEETGDGFRSLREKYFPLEKDEFKAINNLNQNYNYKENVATNMWLNRVIDENDISISFFSIFVNKPYKISPGDIIKVPKR